jgi:hypothetical protein
MLGITFNQVLPGDRPKADDENALRRQVEALSNIQGPGLKSFGNHYRRSTPPGSGGASCTRVRFQVVVADHVTRTALCAIVSRPYGCSESDIPDTALDGAVVEICDPAGCFFNDPNDEIEGREGWAEYMMPVSGSTFCQDGEYVLVPEWQVYSLCCKTDRCNI